MKIGVIAEEKNDIEVLEELTSKITPNRNFSFKRFVAHGCGKLRRKCNSWAKNLISRGCQYIIILHDLDNKDEESLRKDFKAIMRDVCSEKYLLLIPVQEIEAWLLSDPNALKKAFNIHKPLKVPSRPERIPNPKEKLKGIIQKYSKKYYSNTIHNKKIATLMQIDKLKEYSSFRPYANFINHISTSY